MHFDLDDNQRLLQQSVSRLLNDTYSSTGRREIRASPEGFSRALWRQYAELGVLALPLPAEFGGLAGSAQDVGLVMEEFGRALVSEPYLSTVLLGAGLVAQIGSPAQREELLPKVAAGELLLAVAHSERAARFHPETLATTATRSEGGWVLHGSKVMVLGGASADQLLVSAATGEGLGLFVLPVNASGIRRVNFPMIDGQHGSNIELDHVCVGQSALLGGEKDAWDALRAVLDRATVAYCSFAVGATAALLATTAEYLNTRVQFGKPLAANQALRHRVADMAVACEEASSITLRAAMMSGREAIALAASAAKSKVGRCGRFVAEQAVQLHGGMGVTEELDVGLYFKALVAFEFLLGTVDYHRQRYLSLKKSAGVSGS